jgi:flagellar basal body-associated protein FliL
MADEGDEKKQEQNQESKADSGDKKSSGGRLFWIVAAVVVIVSAGAGFGLGRLFGSSQTNQADQTVEDGSAQSQDLTADTADLTAKEPQDTWYYTLEPVVANLNEPSVTRYVRVTLTLVMDSHIDQTKGTAFIEEKKPILTNWLTIYLASLTLEDIRGDRNLKRIQSQIADGFNEKLFPDAKPQLKRVLFKEIAVQ